PHPEGVRAPARGRDPDRRADRAHVARAGVLHAAAREDVVHPALARPAAAEHHHRAAPRGRPVGSASARARARPGGVTDPVTRIARAYPDRVEVRGRDLTGDLMGRLTFTEYVHFLLTGEEPTAEQRFFLDLLLIAIAEHGMMPTSVAARMTLAADPGSL